MDPGTGTIAAIATVVFVVLVAIILGSFLGEGLAKDVNKSQYGQSIRDAQYYFEDFCSSRDVGIFNSVYVVFAPLKSAVGEYNCLAYSLGFSKNDMARTFADSNERDKIIKIIKCAEEYLDAAIASAGTSASQQGSFNAENTEEFKTYRDKIRSLGGKTPFARKAYHRF